MNMMMGCIRCHGPLDYNWKCPICDRPDNTTAEMMKIMWQPTQRTDSDCFSACLAWLLDLPIEQVPDFTDPEDPKSGKFYHNVADFLRPRGLRMMMVNWRSMPAMLGGPVIARGRSPREKAHAVLWDDEGLLHDPHPSRAGLVGEPTHAMLIVATPK